MRKTNKKGFTIVELVIVIAVIAILAAVMIPTFSGIIKKANVAKDTQLVRNLNTALASDLNEHNTMTDALAAAAAFGYDVAKINASATDNEILWDSVNDTFCYLNNGAVEYIPEFPEKVTVTNASDFWAIDNKPQNSLINGNSTSIYLYDYEGTSITVIGHGIDVGECNVGTITYENESDSDLEVVIRTNGGNLVIGSADKTALGVIHHYGESGIVNVINVDTMSYHLFGKAQLVKVEKGHVVIEASAAANSVYVVDNAADIDIESEAAVEFVGVAEGVTNAKVDGATPVVSDLESVQAGATMFAGGIGTSDAPYLIENAEQFNNINSMYETYYYYQVKDGVKTIDLTDNDYVNLNGSFNGNGVVFTNVTAAMFGTVGTQVDEDANKCILMNFTVQNAGGWGIVYECGAKTLEFNNVHVSGYSIHNWNAGEFVRYGHNAGFDYTVNFVKCSCNAEIYSTNNAWSSILVGHTYPGTDAVATINVDADTNKNIDASTLYYSGNDKGHKYYGMGAVNLVVEGVETPNNSDIKNAVLVDSKKAPAKVTTEDSTSYTITPEADTAKIVVSLLWQYTEYTENYAEKIANRAGVGGSIGEAITIEISDAATLEVFKSVTSVEIVTGSGKWDYELKDGKLILYMTTTNTYIDGNVTLFVEQYTASSNIAKYKGSLTLASKVTSSEWVIK